MLAKFSQFGSIVKISMKGKLCFVEFETSKEASKAINTFNGTDIFNNGNVNVCRAGSYYAMERPKVGRCFKCNKNGHQSAQCPGILKCINCGGEGHLTS